MWCAANHRAFCVWVWMLTYRTGFLGNSLLWWQNWTAPPEYGRNVSLWQYKKSSAMLLSLFFSFSFSDFLEQRNSIYAGSRLLRVPSRLYCRLDLKSRLYVIFPERQEGRLMWATHGRLRKTSINMLSQKTGNMSFAERQEGRLMWANHVRLGRKKNCINMSSQKTGSPDMVFCENWKFLYTLPSVESTASIYRLDRH